VTVTFDNPATTLATVGADANGNVNAMVTVPAGAAPGAHQLTTSGESVRVQQPIYVVAPAP
jgi:hypothetical protein